jgi:serine/threonine-protein kinase
MLANKSVVSSAQTGTIVPGGDSASVANDANTARRPDNSSSIKKVTSRERKKEVADSLIVVRQKAKADAQKNPGAAKQVAVIKEETTPAGDNTDEENDAGGSRYKVRNKAYFHDEPDETTKRQAFITHWNNAVLKPLDEKDGFIYVVYKNHEGQTSKGWLSKADLLQVK